MPDKADSFRTLMTRARDGSQQAARELFERYGQRLLDAIRRRLRHPLRTRFDSADFAQDVWASFFTGALERHFDNADELLAYLARMAKNKVCDAGVRHTRAQKRTLHREQTLQVDIAGTQPDRAQPTPSQFVMAEEEWERLLADAPEHHRRILVLLRQGHTHAEIAEKLNTTTKTIQRLLRHIRPGLA